VLSREAELRTLRAQIDPHFLFNSLHSISALTGRDPAGARRMTVQLGDFLRESLALGSAERIPLSRELALAAKYLEVERVRLGDRLQVSITEADAGDCLVPPLVLQPIVENAVTHGVAHVLSGGTVTVTASCAAERLTLTVENPADPDRPRKTGTGLGLANVRARLRAVFGDEASIHWVEQEGSWRVDVSVPAIRPQPRG
jgi:LytS/YehU family sensor histidine kinase